MNRNSKTISRCRKLFINLAKLPKNYSKSIMRNSNKSNQNSLQSKRISMTFSNLINSLLHSNKYSKKSVAEMNSTH